jgi:hypothetical protein
MTLNVEYLGHFEVKFGTALGYGLGDWVGSIHEENENTVTNLVLLLLESQFPFSH